MRLSIFGLGYVGSTSLACLAELGHEMYGVDINSDKVELVNGGQSPVFEPGVSELLNKHHAAGTARAGTDTMDALENSDAALISVGTPSGSDGTVVTTHLAEVVASIARARKELGRTIPLIVRSTALPTVHVYLVRIVADEVEGTQPTTYCVHPKFLRTGQAVDDFMNPPKVVFGCTDSAAVAACNALYPGFEAPVFHTDPLTAAMVKYADNCLHAVKVTFANEIGMLCKEMGVDSRQVMGLFRQDTKLNISTAYLKLGFAFGGSCLPKDLRAALSWARQNMVSLPMLDQVMPSNRLQIERVLQRIRDLNPKTVGLFGLAFKAQTDDLREFPMVFLAESLMGKGYNIRIFDPALSVNEMVGANHSFALGALPHLVDMLTDDPAVVVQKSDVVVVTRDFADVTWPDLPWRDDQAVFDLTGNLDLTGMKAKVEGLYWSADAAGGGEET